MGEVQERLERSREWVAVLDRSVIGNFAVDDEFLVLSHAIASVAVEDFAGSPVNADVRNTLMGRRYERGSTLIASENGIGVTEMVTQGIAEVFVWWGRQGVNKKFTEQDEYEQFRPRCSFINTLINRPERLPYYEVGIHNRSFINKCITDGVDAELAVSMMPIEAIGLPEFAPVVQGFYDDDWAI